jgi:uncharacterized protein YbjT (DUF2867 family)
MPRTALLAGATGLVGGHLLDTLLADPRWARIISVSRRASGRSDPKLEEVPTDFERLVDTLPATPADTAFCCLGTTMRQAGSRPAFQRVDLDYVQAFARAARDRGVETFVLNSSVGADPAASNFYLRTKGEAEAACEAIGFTSLLIFRPGLLRGRRRDFRLGERLGLLAAPLTDRLLLGALARYRSTDARVLARRMAAEALAAPAGVHVLAGQDISEPGSR